jgi:hypothetical protein
MSLKYGQIIIQNMCPDFVTFLEAKGRLNHGVWKNYVNHKMTIAKTHYEGHEV